MASYSGLSRLKGLGLLRSLLGFFGFLLWLSAGSFWSLSGSSFGSVGDAFWLSCGILGARTAGQCPKTAPLQVLLAFLGILLVTFAVLRQSGSSFVLSLSPKGQKWSQNSPPNNL